MKKSMILLLTVLLLVLSFSPMVLAEPEEADEIDSSYTQLSILVTVEKLESGAVKATLYDSDGGVVAAWPVHLTVDGEEVDVIYTSSEGTAVFDYDVSSASTVSCTADSGSYENYYFIGETAILGEQKETVTTTTATKPSATTGTGSVSEIFAPTTTAIDADMVGVGVDLDNGALNMFQLTSAAFNERARMWMKTETYQALVASPNATVHLSMCLNAEAADKQSLIAAKNETPAFAAYSDNQVKGFAFDYALYYIEDGERVEIPAVDADYRIELPVPESLKSCEKLAIAVCTADGLRSMTDVTPTGGTLIFTIEKFQTIAFIGFQGDTQAISSLEGTPSQLIVIGAVGLVLVLLGILLLVFVVFRRQKSKNAAAEHGVRHVLLTPTADEMIDLSVDSEKKRQSVIMDLDEHLSLSSEQKEQFRAKAADNDDGLEKIELTAVSPAEQVSKPSAFSKAFEKPITVDELLKELEETENAIRTEEND